MKLHREGYKYVLIASAVWALLGFTLVRLLVDWPGIIPGFSLSATQA